MALLIDIGNSATKIVRARGRGLRRLASFPTARMREHRGKILGCLAGREGTIAVSSVVPRALEILEEILREGSRAEVRVAGRDLRIPIRSDVEERGAVGTDRLLESLGAWSDLRGKGRALIVVGFGSAITFNCVNARGVFLGGVIFPGFGLCAEALARETAALPDVEVLPAVAGIGKNTREAIRIGVFQGVVGAVSGILEELAAEMGGEPEVYATGGGASAIAPHVARIRTVDEFLLFRGLQAALAGGGKQRRRRV
ncbi:MAG: type III pantothenate kinase [Planctomycetota bacterium]